MLFKLENNEELFHDWLLCIINKAPNYDPKKGKLSNWMIKIGEHKLWLSKKKKVRTLQVISYENISVKVDEKQTHFLDVNNSSIDYGEFTQDQTEHLEEKLSILSTQEQNFISDYINRNTDRTPKTRMKYSRLLAKLKATEH